MSYSKNKLFLILIFVVLGFYLAKAQNHFYTTIKIPLTDYISALVDGNKNNVSEANDETDGISLNAGYAIKLVPDFYNELGFDYLILNKAVKTSFNKETRLENTNSVFAFQTKPTYRPSISADDDVFLTLGMTINFQKIYSQGNFSTTKTATFATDKKHSPWFLNTQPNLGIEFIGENKLGYRFGITYARYNWTKVEKNLSYQNNPGLVTDPHITSNVFFSGGFIF